MFNINLVSAGPSAVEEWLLIDDFEAPKLLPDWQIADPDNHTNPRVASPQVFKRVEQESNNFVLKKPAEDGIIGNRSALSFKALPKIIQLGETFTIYNRINIEYFPNNHSFGLSNLSATNIINENYNAFEPMIRVTDKAEADGSKNDGTLMVSSGYKTYEKVFFVKQNKSASPLLSDQWYELWWVVNNDYKSNGGQTFDLYIRGGEFKSQSLVYEKASFRMQREKDLRYFFMISNTGPKNAPYGNGGLRYDDLYMARGENLSTPQ